jgi:hypothetical protein
MSEATEDEINAAHYHVTPTLEVACSAEGVVDIYQYDAPGPDASNVDLVSLPLATFRKLAAAVERHYASATADSRPLAASTLKSPEIPGLNSQEGE